MLADVISVVLQEHEKAIWGQSKASASSLSFTVKDTQGKEYKKLSKSRFSG